MRIRSYTTEEMEREARTGYFYPGADFESEADEARFYQQKTELNEALRRFLEKLLKTKELEGFCVSDAIGRNYGAPVEIVSRYITHKFLLNLINFLSEYDPRFVIVIKIFNESLVGDNFIGVILAGKDIVHVEKRILKDKRLLKELREFESNVVKK